MFEESTAMALTPNLLGNSTILGFLKSGGNLAYISVLKFLQVSVISITHFKIVIVLYMLVF